MKTLTVSLADIEDVPHGSIPASTSARVRVSYTGPVVLTSGEIIPQVVKERGVPATGVVEFSVHASDDPLVKAEYHGFAVKVEVTLSSSRSDHAVGRWVSVVKPLEAMSSPISLGTLDPAEPLPPQWMTVTEVVSDFDARLDALEANPGGGTANISPHPSWAWALLIADEATTPPPPTNSAPVALINTGATSITDLSATLAWSATDADSDPLTYSIDWGDGQTTPAATSPSAHIYAEGGTFTAIVTASDGFATGLASHEFLAIDPASETTAFDDQAMTLAPLVYLPLTESAAPAIDLVGTTTPSSTTWPTFGFTPGQGAFTASADFAQNSSQYISLGQPAALTGGFPQWTVMCIVTFDGTNGIWYILSADGVNAIRSFDFQHSNDKVRFRILAPTVLTLNFTTTLTANQPLFLATTYDGTTMRAYRNGVADGTLETAAGAMPAAAVNWSIGARDDVVTTPADGRLNGVGIYNKALSAAEIAQLHATTGIPS